MTEREKRGKDGNKKFEYLDNEKRFFGEIKSNFRNYFKAVIWWKKWKIADTSFKGCVRYIFVQNRALLERENFF